MLREDGIMATVWQIPAGKPAMASYRAESLIDPRKA